MQSVYEPNRRIGTTRCPRTTRSANAIVGPVTTKAWLEGHLFDLAALADLLAVGDVRVVRDDGDDENRYYLTAPEIDNPSEPGRFDQPAELLIGRINGLARTRDASYRPVSLSGIYTSPHGQHVFPRRRRIRRTGAFIHAHARSSRGRPTVFTPFRGERRAPIDGFQQADRCVRPGCLDVHQ